MQEFYNTRPVIPPSRAILVGVKLRNTEMCEAEESLQELRQLAETAGIGVACETIQSRLVPNSTFFIGGGKVEELRVLIEELEVDAIIFDLEDAVAPDAGTAAAHLVAQPIDAEQLSAAIPLRDHRFGRRGTGEESVGIRVVLKTHQTDCMEHYRTK